MHTAVAYDPRNKPQKADVKKGPTEPNKQPWWESRAKALFNPEAGTDPGDPLEKWIRSWLARKSNTVGEKHENKKGPIVELDAEKKSNDEIYAVDEKVKNKRKSGQNLHSRPKKADDEEVSEESEERNPGRTKEDPLKEMRRYQEMKRDDPNFFGPTGAGRNEKRTDRQEDDKDNKDDKESKDDEEDEEESSQLGSNFSLRKQMMEPDEKEEGGEESEGLRSSADEKIKRKHEKFERKMLASIKDSIQSKHGKEKRKGKYTKAGNLLGQAEKRKSRQERKKKPFSNKARFVRPAPPRSPVKSGLDDVEDQGLDYGDDDEEYPEMHREFRSYQHDPIPPDFDLLKNLPDSNYDDEPYYDDSNYD